MAELKVVQVGEDPKDPESYTVIAAEPEPDKPADDKKPASASRKVR